jgi:hypothetical protein
VRVSAGTSTDVEMSCMNCDAHRWDLLAHGRSLLEVYDGTMLGQWATLFSLSPSH